MDEITETAVRRFITLLRTDFAIDQAILYGSRARGSHQPDSDADVAVLMVGPREPFMPTAFAMDDIAYDVYLQTGVDISPLPIWADDWANPDDHSNPALLRKIAVEGIRL